MFTANASLNTELVPLITKGSKPNSIGALCM
jgi:hypothetical protein